jgi:exosortase
LEEKWTNDADRLAEGDADTFAVSPAASSQIRPAKVDARWQVAAVACLAGLFVWTYWSTLVELVATWDREPDYSHGYLVVPVALFFLWARREQFPGFAERLAWPGLGLVALSIATHALGARYYLFPVEGWAILLWTAGAVWWLCGWRVLQWSLPSVLFLWFMVPLPYSYEHALSRPLQLTATKASAWVLQCLGQPALSENNTLYLNEPIGIDEACSGLRIFMGIVALAFVYVVLVRRTWWEKAILAASVVPVALAANVARIVATALLFQCIAGETGRQRVHDWSGYAMVPLAAALFALVLWYLGKLVQTVDVVSVRDVVRRQHAEAQTK